MRLLIKRTDAQAFPDENGKVHGDPLDASRGAVNGCMIGVLLWAAIICVFLLFKAHAC